MMVSYSKVSYNDHAIDVMMCRRITMVSGESIVWLPITTVTGALSFNIPFPAQSAFCDKSARLAFLCATQCLCESSKSIQLKYKKECRKAMINRWLGACLAGCQQIQGWAAKSALKAGLSRRAYLNVLLFLSSTAAGSPYVHTDRAAPHTSLMAAASATTQP